MATQKDILVPEAGVAAQLVVPACGQAWRVLAEGECLGEAEAHWTQRRAAVGLLAGTRIQMELGEERDPDFGGFLPDIGVAPEGFWQGLRWETVRGLGFAGRPSLRWREGRLRLTGRLVDGLAAPVDARSEDVELVIDGEEARAVDPDAWELVSGRPTSWIPGVGAFDEVELELRWRGDCVERRVVRVAQVELSTQGGRVLWNGEPFRVQGLLHWGCYPDLAGPDPEPDALRRELRAMRDRGFNLLKACLWIPPHRFLDVCDEEGMAVWIEYPLWNRALLPAEEADPQRGVTRDVALRRYEDFVRHDAAHPCVALRTLTCENDHVDPEVAREILGRIGELAPSGLANDNSAWLETGLQPDFWDEHVYLHMAQWPHWLERTRRALDRRAPKPLILGETMAFDALGDPSSRRLSVALRARQVEQLRQVFPDAGYVICAARDIPLSPLGLQDESGAWKTEVEEWAWQKRALEGQTPDASEDRNPTHVRVARRDDLRDLEPRDLPREVLLAATLDSDARAALDHGRVVLHPATPRAGSWRCPEQLFWSPVHACDELLRGTAAERIVDAELFLDLLSGRSLVPAPAEGMRPLVSLRDVHDRSGGTREIPLVLAARVGSGLLIVSGLRTDTAAGREFHASLMECCLGSDRWSERAPLDLGPSPRTIFLDGPWTLRGEGVRGGEQRLAPGTMLLRGGANAVLGRVEALATMALPGDWEGPPWLRAEGIGDGFELDLDDQRVHVHGRPGWTWDAGRDRPATVDLSDLLQPGQTRQWRIRTQDHRGAGVLIGPLYITDRPPEESLVY